MIPAEVRVLARGQRGTMLEGEVTEWLRGERKLIVHVVEGACESGAPGLAISVQRDDGTWFRFETTAKLFCAIAGAVRGASQRFGFHDIG